MKAILWCENCGKVAELNVTEDNITHIDLNFINLKISHHKFLICEECAKELAKTIGEFCAKAEDMR